MRKKKKKLTFFTSFNIFYNRDIKPLTNYL